MTTPVVVMAGIFYVFVERGGRVYVIGEVVRGHVRSALAVCLQRGGRGGS